MNRLKWFCKWFCFRGDIREISDSALTNTPLTTNLHKICLCRPFPRAGHATIFSLRDKALKLSRQVTNFRLREPRQLLSFNFPRHPCLGINVPLPPLMRLLCVWEQSDGKLVQLSVGSARTSALLATPSALLATPASPPFSPLPPPSFPYPCVLGGWVKGEVTYNTHTLP